MIERNKLPSVSLMIRNSKENGLIIKICLFKMLVNEIISLEKSERKTYLYKDKRFYTKT